MAHRSGMIGGTMDMRQVIQRAPTHDVQWAADNYNHFPLSAEIELYNRRNVIVSKRKSLATAGNYDLLMPQHWTGSLGACDNL
jgi:hypothetical protein